MFKTMFSKIKKEGGEDKMKTKIILCSLVITAIVLGISVPAFCDKQAVIQVTATVPTQANNLVEDINKVVPADCTGQNDTNWSAATAIAFGNLQWDSQWSIFRGTSYYVVDGWVNGNQDYTITHTRTNLNDAAGNSLNGNVNVVFKKAGWVPNGASLGNSTCTNPAGCGKDISELAKYTYGNSNSKAYTKTQLKYTEGGVEKEGHVRIYYGIASGIGPTTPNPGNCSRDAADNMAITAAKPIGTYTGQVTLTVTP